MNPPSFWAHNGALYMSMKEIAALKWSSSSQSSKKLKGKVLKACDVGLLLSGGGQAPKYVHTDDVEKIVVLEMRDEASRIIARQKGRVIQVPFPHVTEPQCATVSFFLCCTFFSFVIPSPHFCFLQPQEAEDVGAGVAPLEDCPSTQVVLFSLLSSV